MRMRIPATATFGLLSILAACSSSTGPKVLYDELDPEPVCTMEEVAPSAEWQVVDRGAFRFRVPPDFRHVQLQAVDSDAQVWASSERRFASYDYGWYSNTLNGAQDALTGSSACRDTIGGFPVAVVSGWDTAGTWEYGSGSKYVIAGSWRNVLPGYDPAVHLTLTAASDRPEDRRVLLAILRSVRFIP
jgi:hypothetical protein